MVRAPHRPAHVSEAILGLWAAALAVAVVAGLYFMRDILIPLALATLLTFLLAPLVSRLERSLGRIFAVATVSVVICAAAAMLMWTFSRQLVDLAEKLPDYKANLRAKLQAFRSAEPGLVSRLSRMMEDLKQDLPGAEPEAANPKDSRTPKPQPVEIVTNHSANAMEIVRTFVAPLVGPLGTSALVVVLTICMLLQREDLRARLIRLIGQRRISVTKRAMEDAGARVSRFLLTQALVNAGFGAAVALGLFCIGLPNALLWGVFAGLLRFVPYVGAWISASLPILLSLAVSTSWRMPLLTIGLFLAIELIANNVVEPWLYGHSTGVSSLALIVAAIFWTWLWGAVGLILATPLTVCLVVIGRHVPRLHFLDILLSDQQALTPAEECYHRLLMASRLEEAVEFAAQYRQEHSLAALFDEVLLPALAAAERDQQNAALDEQQVENLTRGLREILDFLASAPSLAPAEQGLPRRVSILAARSERDELAAAMLAQLLAERGRPAQVLPPGAPLPADGGDVCISVVAPTLGLHAGHLLERLRPQLGSARVVVGLWGARERFAQAQERLQAAGAQSVSRQLGEAADYLLREGAVV